MIIYYVSRTIRKERKAGVTIEHRILGFSPNLEEMMKLARNLSSRYKKRFVVLCNEFKNGKSVHLKSIVAYECSGKNKPVIQTR